MIFANDIDREGSGYIQYAILGVPPTLPYSHTSIPAYTLTHTDE